MDIAALLTALAVLILVVLYLAQPLIERRGGAGSRTAGLSPLQAELDRTIDTLRELDFDRALGKIPEDEYPARRQELVARGADLLRRLDEAGATVGEAGSAGERLEREVASRRMAPVPAGDAAIEAEISARRARAATPNGAGRKAGFCPSCGLQVQVGDKFCPRCGKALRHEESA